MTLLIISGRVAGVACATIVSHCVMSMLLFDLSQSSIGDEALPRLGNEDQPCDVRLQVASGVSLMSMVRQTGRP